MHQTMALTHRPPSPPRTTLFPYTTLFRSHLLEGGHARQGRLHVAPLLPSREQRFQLFQDRKSTRLNSSHVRISYAVFCLKKESAYEHAADAAPNKPRPNSNTFLRPAPSPQ